MKTANYQTAENITYFLGQQSGSVKKFIGKMPKAQQLEVFGYYFGKGTIGIYPETETVVHSVKVAFGQDWDITAIMEFDGSFQFNNR